MNHAKHFIVFTGLICLLGTMAFAAVAPKAAPEVLPTIADVRQQFTDGKYTDVVRNVSKITTSREWQAKKEDAYELYTIKGEAHLHLKESALAAASFESAAKVAMDQLAIDKAAADKAAMDKPDDALEAKVTADHAAAGTARANAYLIKHSVGLFFVPKATSNQRVAGGSPDDHIKFEILGPDKRKQALTALWTDEKATNAAKFEAASSLDNKSPAAVMDAAALIPNLRDFDFAANGNDDDTKKVAGAVAEHGRDVFQEMLDKSIMRLDLIATDAESVTTSRAGLPGGGYADRWHKHGLEGKQPAELQEMLKTTNKIAAAIKVLQEEMYAEKDTFDKPNKDIKRIKEQVDKLMKIDPAQSFVTREAAMKS